jgi:NAD(P)-dependent dehydrogenase (short-subunit alcohol dehydrogenase family)
VSNHINKSILITGCSSGFGQATARHFAQQGWRVYATMRNPAAGEALQKEAAEKGWRLSTPALDVTDENQVNAVVAEILSQPEGLDVLVNNAGYFCVGSVEDTTPADLQAQFNTNVLGALRMSRAVLPAFRAKGAGRIINVSSLAALSVVPFLGAYHASKAALESLTEALHYEVAPFGIAVSSILPGPFTTELVANQVRVDSTKESTSAYRAQVDHFESLNNKAPRGKVQTVVNAIATAATTARPRLRYAVGPLSFLATYGYPITPQWLYAFLVRWFFRLPVRK